MVGPAARVVLAAAALAWPTPVPPPPTLAMSEPGYRVVRTTAPHEALVGADPPAWQSVPAVSWGPDPYRTGFQAVWNDRGLFVRFDAEDDAPWHTMTGRDDHIWEEEVVEIFIDPDRSGRHYAELEISPANVVCDVRMIEPAPEKRMDLAWNFTGLETRVVPFERDGVVRGWTATAFMPWADFATLYDTPRLTLPPAAGIAWRFNLFRIKRPGGPSRPGEGSIQAAWSPTGQSSFHVPSAFRDLLFVAE